MITENELQQIMKAINKECPYHKGTGKNCLHFIIGKLVGAASLAGRLAKAPPSQGGKPAKRVKPESS